MMRAIKFVTITTAILLLVPVCWLAFKRYRVAEDQRQNNVIREGAEKLRSCTLRGVTYEQRIKQIEADAERELKVGATKAEVEQFYVTHKIPFRFESSGSMLIGTLDTLGGCPPLGCGTSNALIGVRVKVDADGTVIKPADVVAMYTDCV
jgi:hypothetical protein